MAWTRIGDEEHDGSVTIICNGTGDGEKKCEVGKEHAGEKWTDLLGWHQGEVTIDEGVCSILPPSSRYVCTSLCEILQRYNAFLRSGERRKS